MRLLLACIIYFYTISQGSAYVFPICNSKNVNSCTKFFAFPSLSFFNAQGAKVEEKEIFLENPSDYGYYFNVFNIFYKDSFETKLPNAYYQSFINFVSTITGPCISVLKYVPFLGLDEKAKANSRLYFLFILCSLGIYLVLYFYFASKLYYFYQARLRRQYLEKVKKALKSKE